MAENNWYTIKDVEKLDTPALVIYPQRVKENIDILKGMIDDVSRLRPHVKTHKSKEAALLMLDEGINKFKCATIAEAEMLGMANAPDVLLAYQPVGPKLERLIELNKIYPFCMSRETSDSLAIQIPNDNFRAEADSGHTLPVGTERCEV